MIWIHRLSQLYALYGIITFAFCLQVEAQALDRLHRMTPNVFYDGESANTSRLIDSLIYGYDKRLRPNYNGPPVEVGITMFVSSVSSVSEVDMDYTLDFYFRQNWRDPRLKFEDSDDEELCISNEMLEKIWWPDTFFANAKDAKFHKATTKNAFLRIKPSGDVLQSLRLTVTADCKMDLTYFPFDSQICSLEIESYGYSTKDIKYSWHDGRNDSVSIHPDVQLPQFNVKGYRATEKMENLSTGAYSRLSCEFYLVRSIGYYIIQIYVPSCLIVVLSWVSFWLPREAVPARVALGITTILTMTTLISSTNASLPKISYLKSIDVFLVTCFIMVFGSIIEYAAVSFLTNRFKLLQKQLHVEGTHADNTEMKPLCNRAALRLDIPAPHDPGQTVYKRRTNKEKSFEAVKGKGQSMAGSSPAFQQTEPMIEKTVRHLPPVKKRHSAVIQFLKHPSAIDKLSRVFFPLLFSAFNIVYWMYYPGRGGPEDLAGFVLP